MWPVLPDLLAFYRDAVQTAAAGGTPPTAGSPQFEHVRAQMAAFQPIQLLLGVVAMAVVSSGVYRAVLEPEKSAYGYLRLGRQELLVGMVVVVMYMLMVIAVVAVFVPLGIVAAVGQMGGGAAPSWGEGLMLFLMACGAAAGLIYVLLRLSLAPSMSFSERAFRLFESWSLTRGAGWKLFGVAVGAFLCVIGVELLVMGVAGALGAGAMVSNLDGFKAFVAHPPADWPARVAPWVLGLGLAYVVLMGVVTAIITAPFADIYRQLRMTPQIKVFED